MPEALFLICAHGPWHADLKKLAISLGIGERVIFNGWMPHPERHYQAWDVCLFNSDFDALGKTSMEAACHGCLVAASVRRGGLSEFLQHGTNGILLATHEPHASPRKSSLWRQTPSGRTASAKPLPRPFRLVTRSRKGFVFMHPSSPSRSSAVGPLPSEEDGLAGRGGPESLPRPNGNNKRILVVWGNWGPYHHARFRALYEHGQQHNIEIHGLELFPTSGIYDWKVRASHPGLHHLTVGQNETEFNPLRLAWNVMPLLARLRCDVVFVPSYWHWSLFINIMARLCGARIVMMNESHAGTELATGWKKWIKRRIVRSFHAALVGGTPHLEHFTNLGLDSSVVFSGYDAVDNDFFTKQSEECRRDAGTVRDRLALPEEYFLSLGRMISKKNLTTLILGYALYRQKEPKSRHHLVFVGSGDEEPRLREVAAHHNLTILDHPEAVASRDIALPEPTVHFYGFRQIEENPLFYALATAFILPSLKEEWGLVVNEAMACGLPVLVSNRAGCAADLVLSGYNGYKFNPESVDELAAILCRVTDTATRDQMGKHSHEIIRHWGCEKFATGALQAAAVAAPRLSLPTPVLIP